MMRVPHDSKFTILRWSFLVSLFITPFIFVPNFRYFADLPKNCWLQSSAILLLFFWFFTHLIANNKKNALHIAPFLGPIVIFFLWSLVSFSYAINTYEVLLRWTTWAAAFIFFILTVDLFNNEKKIANVLTVVFITGSGVALIGIFQHLNGLNFIPQAARPASTFGNKNMAIHYIILTLPVVFGLFFTSKKEWIKLALPSLFSLQVAYLIFSGTRAGWLAFFVEIIFLIPFMILTRNRDQFQWDQAKSRGVIYALLLFFCLMGIEQVSPNARGQSFSSRIQHTMSQMSSPVKQVRIAYWLNSIAMIKDQPLLGIGLGNFGINYPLYHRKIRKDPSFNVHVHVATPHNDYLQLIVETGLIGFAFAAWVFFRIGSSLTWVFNPSKPVTKNLHAIGMISALFGIGAVAFFSFPFQRSTPPLLTCIYLGLLASLTGNNQKIILHRHYIIIGSLIVGAISIIQVTHQWDRLRSESHLTKATAYYLTENYPASTHDAFKAYTLEPQRNENLYYLGLASLYNGQHAQAIHFLEKDLRYEPNNTIVLSALGLAYGKVGEVDEAMKKFKKSLAIFPENWLTYANMGSIYQANGEFDKAASSYKTALIYHKNKLLWHNLGVAYKSTGDMHQAEQAFIEKQKSPSF